MSCGTSVNSDIRGRLTEAASAARPDMPRIQPRLQALVHHFPAPPEPLIQTHVVEQWHPREVASEEETRTLIELYLPEEEGRMLAECYLSEEQRQQLERAWKENQPAAPAAAAVPAPAPVEPAAPAAVEITVPAPAPIEPAAPAAVEITVPAPAKPVAIFRNVIAPPSAAPAQAAPPVAASHTEPARRAEPAARSSASEEKNVPAPAQRELDTTFGYTKFLTEDEVISLIQTTPGFEIINLRKLTVRIAQELVNKCPHLKEIRAMDTCNDAIAPLAECPHLTRASFGEGENRDLYSNLSLLQHLESLSLGGVGLSDKILDELPLSLRSLRITTARGYTEAGQLSFLKKHPDLEVYSANGVTDSVLQALGPLVHTLYIHKSSFSEEALLKFASTHPSLKRLWIESSSHLSYATLEQLGKTCPELDKLDLGGSGTYKKDLIFAVITQHFPSLSQLGISWRDIFSTCTEYYHGQVENEPPRTLAEKWKAAGKIIWMSKPPYSGS
jgi:hypothetical protein